jgi:hypothetical protein
VKRTHVQEPVARMIRTLIFASILLLGGPALAGDLEDLDAEAGFAGATLGQPLEAFRGLELISERSARGTRLYAATGDAPRLGDARLDDVTYGFYQGRLYFLALFTSGRSNAEAALAALRASYGPGKAVPGEASEYVWHGSRVTLHFREDPVTKLGMVGFTDRTVVLEDPGVATAETLPANAAD